MNQRILRLGLKGTDVEEVQMILKEQGYYTYEVTGYFGVLTRDALKKYQCDKKLVCSGDEYSTGWGQVGAKTTLSLYPNPFLLPAVTRLRDGLLDAWTTAGKGKLLVTSEYRSFAEQDLLYAQGRTRPGAIVTNAKGGESLHNYRVAFDVAFLKSGSTTYDGDWTTLSKVGKDMGLEWGGDWATFPDKPHFQYTAGYSLADFQKGKVDYKKFNI